MKSRKLFLRLLPFVSLFFFFACAQTPKNYNSPMGYDFTNGQLVFLPDALHELSGIAFPTESDEYIFANEDENGKVYFFDPDNPQLQETKFGKKGDYEGIAISNGYVVVLESKGTVFTFPYADIGQKEVTAVREEKNLIPKEEYESLAASSTDSLLYILCKQCDVDKGAKTVTGYILGLSKDGNVFKKGEFKIDEEQIDRFSSLKGKSFRPSALTLNTQTNQWYILSAINKMLMVADENWKVVGAYSLDPSLFNQPEAIAFDHSGNLFIGNEGGDKTRKGTLLKFNLLH